MRGTVDFMLGSIRESPLYPIVNPRSIAFFGASNNSAAMGTTLLNSLLALGYEGTVYPVHPREAQVQGLRAYGKADDLPEVPDLAVLVLPTDIVCEKLDECGRKGIGHAIVVSGGFRESGDEEGRRRQERLVETAARHGMRFIGPNCIGVANPHQKLNTTFLRYEGTPGFIGMASQSGSFVTQMFGYLDQFGLGFSTAFSVGNEANIDIVDCMEYLGACPHTKVIALYIEGIRRGKEFIEAARSILSRKPIVAYYVGGSETGKQAGFSHTGAMAGPDSLYDGMFRQGGIIRARSMTELFDFCSLLGTMPEPAGRTVVIQTHSGGPGAEAADVCGRVGLQLAELSKRTVEALGSMIPHTGSIKNPVDVTYSKNPLDFFDGIPRVLLEEEGAHILLMYLLMPTESVERTLRRMGVPKDRVGRERETFINRLCDAMVRFLGKYGKPIVGYTYRSFNDEFIQGLLARGMSVYPGPERAVRAIEALVRYYEVRKKMNETGD